MASVMLFIVSILIMLAVSLLGAFLPHMVKMNDRQTHLMIAFSAGIFIGVLFLMFMPEAIHESLEAGFSALDVMYAVMFGFLAMLLLDQIVKSRVKSDCGCDECMDHHSHDITSLSAFIGLAIHACFDGLAFATAFIIGEGVGFAVLLAMCIHKVVVVFSLSSTFLMSNKKDSAKKYLVTFCFISPVAAIISYLFMGGIGIEWTGLALAVSAGIFMFVTMCDMVPEAFHRGELRLKSFAMLAIGIVVAIGVVLLTTLVGGHVH